jgi:hypothetical protein
MRTTFEANGNAVHFHIPPPPASLAAFIPAGCATVFSGIFVSTMLAELMKSSAPGGQKLALGGVIVFFFVVLPIGGTLIGALSQRRKRWDVVADPSELRVTTFGLLGGRDSVIPASKLEELRLETTKSDGCRIVAISDEVRATFGEGLPQVEAQWIISVIKRAVTA